MVKYDRLFRGLIALKIGFRFPQQTEPTYKSTSSGFPQERWVRHVGNHFLLTGSSVSAVCVDPSGRLLVTGHEDSTCMLYDITGCKIIQCFQPHNAELRTIRFSPKARYLLTGSYDHKVILSDLQGDLSQPIPGIVVAEHKDKVIQARWHPTDFSILTTSADKNVILWGFPTN
ncbi:WD repeat-containing protein 47-like [Tachypleus tridentatus]|uniref:WD repeat-containing protein 47-like n=1 Tax=Tachypleus tridentatus TaxID=6853 RepID=UPI003FD4AAB6